MDGDVLIVDDNPANLHLLLELLSDHDFSVRVARNGAAALDTVRRLPPDVILLDIRMPQMDGYEVCRQLKQDPTLKDIPVIFVTAADDILDKVKAFSVGGVDYIMRPFQAEEVIARVTTHVNLYRALTTAQELAILQERQRLARELHDAVNQTLFSLSLTADTAMRSLRQGTEATRPFIQELQQLIHEAKAEMRVLMYELRPESLHDAPLHQLLSNLANTLTGKIDIHLHCELQEVTALPADVTIIFYRIAQETMTNIIKHARARTVYIQLEALGDGAQMTIRDDGIGFDVQCVPSNHYGLHNMRERAAAIGAAYALDSAPSQGTQMQLCWQGNI